MLAEIIGICLGIGVGTFTGLLPGIHINLVVTLLIASQNKLTNDLILPALFFITAMSITHTLLDIIPSIFLGAPEEDTFLAVLPGHKMLQHGDGYEAVILTLYGASISLGVCLIAAPIYVLFLPSLYNLIKDIIPFILIGISTYIIARDSQPIKALVLFLGTGILGLVTFNLPVKEPLLVLLSGLFGFSSILLTIGNKKIFPLQKIKSLKNIYLSKEEFRNATLGATLAAPLCSFLPGIGSGHAAVMASEILPQTNRSFLMLTGAINTTVMMLSFVTVYTIGKARSGSAAAIQEIAGKLTLENMILLSIVSTIVIITTLFMAVYLTKIAANIFNKINYKKLSMCTILFLSIVVIYFSNWLGVIVTITSTAWGIYASQSNVRKINAMGALIIPAILFYLTS